MTKTEAPKVVAEAKALIGRPVEDVFSYVSDPTNEARWHTDILQVRPAPGSTTESVPENYGIRGSMWIWTGRFMGRTTEGEVEVTAFEPNHRIEITTRTGPVLPIANCLFEPANGGTLFTRRTEIPTRGIYRLLAPLLQRMASKSQERYVVNLKHVLESDGG